MNIRQMVKEFVTGKKTSKEEIREEESFEFITPSPSLLGGPMETNQDSDTSPAELANLLNQFGFNGTVEDVRVGPTVTLYRIRPFGSQSMKPLARFLPDIALRLGAESARFLGQLPGETVVGLEISNRDRGSVNLRDVIYESEISNYSIPVSLGVGAQGDPIYFDLAKAPHLLVAGATGAGNSVFLQSMISGVLARKTPYEVMFCMIDPKEVELSTYRSIPHNLLSVATDPSRAGIVLQSMIWLMEKRYRLMAEMGAQSFEELNRIAEDRYNDYGFSRVVVLIDEFADLIMLDPQLETPIIRLAQKARAAGIHLVLATQRPVVKVVTGLIKANIPARLAFRTSSAIDSRVILDEKGAEKLLGSGDLLFKSSQFPEPVRSQAPMTDKRDIEKLVAYWTSDACKQQL